MTLNQLYRKCIKLLGSSSDTPGLDARIIAQYVLNIEYNSFILHSQDIVSPLDEQAILELIARRADGEPVAYLTGQRGFFEDVFVVNQYTLIPRADTEILVEEAIKLGLESSKTHLEILDLCCGTGCIGISVAKALAKQGKDVSLVLSDISKEALEVCSENCRRILSSIGIKYEVVMGDLFEGVKTKDFDLLLTNPPYIATAVIETLQEQVKREPHLALDGGEDGLELIKKIVAVTPKHLKEGSHLLMEIGYDQGQAVKKLFEDANLSQIEIKKDLGGRARVVIGAF